MGQLAHVGQEVGWAWAQETLQKRKCSSLRNLETASSLARFLGVIPSRLSAPFLLKHLFLANHRTGCPKAQI
jgi:hypothetical protein